MKINIIILFILLCSSFNFLFADESKWSFFDCFNSNVKAKDDFFLFIEQNDTFYTIKMICICGVPYRGELYIDTLQPTIRRVNYWSRGHLFRAGGDLLTGKIKFLQDIKITNTSITFECANAVTVHIVDILAGVRVLSHNFSKPITSIDTIKLGGETYISSNSIISIDTAKTVEGRLVSYSNSWLEEQEESLYGGDVEQLTDYILLEIPEETSYLNISSLPSGTYFAYFVNTIDGKLRWVEKIIKKN